MPNFVSWVPMSSRWNATTAIHANEMASASLSMLAATKTAALQ